MSRADAATAFQPWQRALAAGVDLLIVATIISLLQMVGADLQLRPFTGGGRVLWIALWAIADAALLVQAGTTPGRKLFGVSIRGADDNALQPSRAAVRAALLALTVLGGGHLILAPVLAVIAFRFVAARGQGWWDIAAGSRATFEDLPPWRRAVGVLALAALLMALFALNADPAQIPASINL